MSYLEQEIAALKRIASFRNQTSFTETRNCLHFFSNKVLGETSKLWDIWSLEGNHCYQISTDIRLLQPTVWLYGSCPAVWVEYRWGKDSGDALIAVPASSRLPVILRQGAPPLFQEFWTNCAHSLPTRYLAHNVTYKDSCVVHLSREDSVYFGGGGTVHSGLAPAEDFWLSDDGFWHLKHPAYVVKD